MATLNLSGDVTISKAQVINRPVTMNLNGHKISTTQTTGYMFNVRNDGKLTLTGNGEIEARYRIGIAQNGGEIIIQNGNYVSTNNVAFEAKNNGKVTFNGGTITALEGGIIAPSANGIIEVNGGVIEGIDNFAIATNGNAGNKGNLITINDGKLIGNITSPGYEAIGVYIANQDVFVMNGGEIIANGGTGICMRGGDVMINGGKIIATGVDKNGNPVADGKVGDNSVVLTGVSAIVYHKHSSYQNEGMRLTVSGGIITGVDKSIDVISDEETPNVFVTGGTLTPAYPAA